MSRGWAIGGDTFKRDLVEDEAMERHVLRQTQAKAREVRQIRWAAALALGLKQLGKNQAHVKKDPKAADWKVAVAAELKQRLMCTNPWLGENLNMGPAAAVCRYIYEARRGKRPAPRNSGSA
jgi:hypothetical protein